MTSINSRTTIREQLTFEQYQELKRKRNKEYNLLVLSIFNKIGNFIWLVFKLFFILFVSVLAGHSTEPLTYGANQIKTDDGNSIKCSCFANGINANIFFDNNSITYDYTRTTSIQ